MVFIQDESGRAITNYTPICELSEQLKAKLGARNDHEFRILLQRNAKQIMEYEKQKTKCTIDKSFLKCDCVKCNIITAKNFIAQIKK